MQELRLVMIVIGAVAIVALLIHGLWTSKKERPAKFNERPIQKVMEKDGDGFDQDGIGSVRVVKPHSHETAAMMLNEEADNPYDNSDPLFSNADLKAKPAPAPVQEQSTVTANPRMKPVKDFYHFEDTEEDIALAEEESKQDEKKAAAAKASEADKVTQVAEVEIEAEPEPEPKTEPPQQQVLIFNVQAQANKEFKGRELFNCLEQFGMHFGEMDIFHCHQDFSPTAPVVFSAANMFNPGTFPVSALDQFSTPGITFFMALPCHGDPEQNFKLMLQIAQQVADMQGGNVTDDGRNLLTPQRLDEYRDIVKQFMS